ncbi:MAG TPA: zinc-binding alcohol dehydrogenase [Anaerolineales bacterium]|nr:zinc-binding alcohol dehydrogenase [Anaerolineales bacterium]
MRSLYFTAPRRIEIRDDQVPETPSGEMLVETSLSAISAGTEMLVYRGQAPAGLAADETIAALGGSLDFPLRYGYAAAGRVIEAGEGIEPGWRGAAVFSFQPHTTHFTAAPGDLVRIPGDVPPEDAVFLPNMETALGLVMDAAPLAGERVAVLGQGVVGLLAAGVLAGFPLERLVAFDAYPIRREAARAFAGAEALAAGALPSGYAGHFDLVFELTGEPAALDDAIALAGEEGRIVVGSWYGTKRAPVDLGGRFHRGRLRLVSSQVSRLAPGLTGRWTRDRRMAFAVDLLRRLRPGRLITHRFPFERAAEAYELLDRRPEEAVQVVLAYGEK